MGWWGYFYIKINRIRTPCSMFHIAIELGFQTPLINKNSELGLPTPDSRLLTPNFPLIYSQTKSI